MNLLPALSGIFEHVELSSRLVRAQQETIEGTMHIGRTNATMALLCFANGSGFVFIGDSKERVRTGQCLLISPDFEYRIAADDAAPLHIFCLNISDEGGRMASVLFDGAYETHLRSRRENGYCRVAASGDICMLSKRLIDEMSAMEKNRDDLAGALLCALILSINRVLSKNPSQTADANALSYIDGAKQYIEDHLGDSLSPSMIAKALFISSGYLMHLFKDYLCATLMEYVYFRRIERSRELLCATDEKITAIAPKVGIPNTQYFSVLFKKQTGLTPREYRKKFSLQPSRDE